MGRDKLDNYESPKYKIKYKIIINVNLHFRLKKKDIHGFIYPL